MPWKLVCDLGIHEILQTTIINQKTKRNEEIKKIKKYCQKPFFVKLHETSGHRLTSMALNI